MKFIQNISSTFFLSLPKNYKNYEKFIPPRNINFWIGNMPFRL